MVQNKKLISYALSVLLLGSSASAITFKDSNSQELQRKMPEGNGVLLSYRDAVKDAKKSVVNIFTEKKVKQSAQNNPFMNDPFFRQFFGNSMGNAAPKERVDKSLGSGVIISSDGYILTNNHVIANADTVMVFLANEKKEYRAKVIGTDPKTDLAVIKIEAGSLQAIGFADSSKVEEGDVVFAIGNPFGVGETITQGIVSALNKSGIGLNEYENFIQTDASINPGNSGGALIDSRGGLIGINSAIISPTGQNNGIGFAIPSNMAKNIAKTLIEKGKIERGMIGVASKDLDAQARKYYGRDNGALVMDVSPGSPAEKAAIKRGDVIVSINGKEIVGSSELKNSVGSMEVGSIVKLGILRDKKLQTVSIKLEKPSTAQTVAATGKTVLIDGVSVIEISDEFRKKMGIPVNIKGIFVESVDENSIGAKAGFMAGDIVIQIENSIITSLSDLLKVQSSLKTLNGKRIFVNRRGVITMIITE